MTTRRLALVPLLAAVLSAVPVLAAPIQPHTDVVAMLRAGNQELLTRPGKPFEQKLAALARSPWAFYRGAAPVFYHDIAQVPALASTIRIPIQGDLHLENMGAYRTRDGQLAFDLNDFDEAITAPYTWELARCAVSIRLAAAQAGFKPDVADRLVDAYVLGYRASLELYLTHPGLLARPLTAAMLKGPAHDALGEAARSTRAELLAKFAPGGHLARGKHVFDVDKDRAAKVLAAFNGYAADQLQGAAYFRVKDLARREAGVGSLGHDRYLLLLEGPTPDAADDVIAEMKEEVPPSVPAEDDPGVRVFKATRYFLPDAEGLLGTASIGHQDFLVHELSPIHADVGVEDLGRLDAFSAYIGSTALITAHAHARSGRGIEIMKESQTDDVLRQRIGSFARDYEQTVVADHLALRRATAKPSL